MRSIQFMGPLRGVSGHLHGETGGHRRWKGDTKNPIALNGENSAAIWRRGHQNKSVGTTRQAKLEDGETWRVVIREIWTRGSKGKGCQQSL